jgi:hypothetical protein
MGTATDYTTSAISEGRWADAGRGAKGLGQMGETLAQVPGEVGTQMVVGTVTFPLRVPKDAWEFGTAARECYAGDRGGWDVLWHSTMLAGDVYTIYGIGTGREIELNGKYDRVAPWGNRTPILEGELPHYHHQITNPAGQTIPGGSYNWHRPWQPSPWSLSWWDLTIFSGSGPLLIPDIMDQED